MVEEQRNYHDRYLLTLVLASISLFSFGILQNVLADTVTVTIPVPGNPTGVSVNPNTNKIYIASSGASASVIDGATNSVSTISAGGQGVAVNPDTNRIYVTSIGDGKVWIVDGVTNTQVGTISATGASAIKVNPVTNKIYVIACCTTTHKVYVIDGVTNVVTDTIPVDVGAACLAIDSKKNVIYGADGNSIVVINGTDNSVSSIPVSSFGVGVNPDTNMIYAIQNNAVAVINGTTRSIISTISVPNAIGCPDINSITNKIYVTNYASNTVTVIDGATNSVVSTIPVGSPDAIGINPNTEKIYVANQGSRSVTVIDGSSIPTAPQNLVATAVSSSQINLSWNAPSNNGGSAISGYKIERSTDGGTTWSTVQSNTGSASTASSDTGLDKKTTYTYCIYAVNGVGTSPPSNIVSATTLKNNHIQHHKYIENNKE